MADLLIAILIAVPIAALFIHFGGDTSKEPWPHGKD